MTPEEVTQEVAKRLRQFHLVMVPAGKAFGCYREAVESACHQRMTVAEFLEHDLSEAAGPILITDLHSVCSLPTTGPHPLGLLRQRVDEALGNGTSIALASRYPKLRFPDVPGSSLLDDARLLHLPMASSENGDPMSCFPSWSADEDAQTWLMELLDELGLELLARLDEILFESPVPANDALGQLPPNELDALYFAGLISPSDGTFRWVSLTLLGALKEAVATALAKPISTTSDMSQIFELLWQVERRIRSSFRSAAITKWGNAWKDSCLTNELKVEVVKRAGEVAYKGVRSVSRLRDPLEWITLGELLDLRERKGADVGTLGVEPRVWKRFALEVLPIRNQVSHMRLTRPSDLPTLSRWSHFLAKSLSP